MVKFGSAGSRLVCLPVSVPGRYALDSVRFRGARRFSSCLHRHSSRGSCDLCGPLDPPPVFPDSCGVSGSHTVHDIRVLRVSGARLFPAFGGFAVSPGQVGSDWQPLDLFPPAVAGCLQPCGSPRLPDPSAASAARRVVGVGLVQSGFPACAGGVGAGGFGGCESGGSEALQQCLADGGVLAGGSKLAHYPSLRCFWSCSRSRLVLRPFRLCFARRSLYLR